MIVGQEVMERTNSPTFCWRSTNKGSFSTDMYGCIFHSFSVWYNFCNAFFIPKPPADHSLRNAVLHYTVLLNSILLDTDLSTCKAR